ncbi:hypothetical protein SAMN05421820_112231 [Pedobacter steynii]|uniref:DUF5977 domain-containing protein n=1 Tax=Pedobacter steynii TaxID=430522 RepID=A0A1H0HRA5_9SPHI|nr:DUF5977 domain-containing protein [Pedobacter steynii]NQX42531.1 hypothetical protein [Pedobacter steynii]SDO21668.1 hypothetical protein SAMN05421820_112231 [Pedobacter steynii]
MKYLKHVFLLALSFLIYHPSQAQGVYGSISNLSVDATSLTPSGKIKLSTTGITNVKYKVTIVRSIDPNNQAPNPTDFNWYPVNIGMGLGMYDKGYVWFEGSATITNADFKAYESSLTKEFTAKIDNSKLISGQKIVLVYEPHPPGVPSSNWSKTAYLSVNYDFEYPVTYYTNDAKSRYFTKNNCPPGSEPSTGYTYTVLALTYSSTISQADANQKAENDILLNGQNQANLHGTCADFGHIKPLSGSMDINWYDYITDVKWNTTSFQGNNVKIEFYSSDQQSLIREVVPSTPNTGLLKQTLVALKWTNESTNFKSEGRLKITSIDTGVSYFSEIFYLRQD